jgi:hypothetical protein
MSPRSKPDELLSNHSRTFGPTTDLTTANAHLRTSAIRHSIARMRTTVPPPFNLPFDGDDGPYTIRFQPTDKWDGIIAVSIRGLTMSWDVVEASEEDDGSVVLGGMTSGSEALWNDQFWFELRLTDTPPVIRYWGDQVIWREDKSG